MLWIIAIVLLILWLIGIIGFGTLNSFVHILLLLAIAVAVIRLLQGRKPS